MAEAAMEDHDDAWVEVEDNEHLPVNQNPVMIQGYYSLVTQFMVAYGWYVLVLAAVAYYLWRTKVRPALRQLRTSTQVAAHKKYDSSEIERRQLAMDAHRRKLQEEHDRKAAEHAARQAELAEQKRLEKLEDWDRHQAGQGYRSKVKKAEETTTAAVLSKNKKRLRDTGFNPLMGNEGPACGFRPGRRGPAAGGG